MRRLLYTIALIVSAAIAANAQTMTGDGLRALYDNAEEDYKIGRLEQAEKSLLANIKDFPSSLRQSAYRLIALCCLGSDRYEEANTYTAMLLDENPYYSTTLNDPQRFVDMVERIKSGRSATITTASSQAENLSEVPVPTTLITEEMIVNSGARNLQEVLAAFVPGMSAVDCNNDINIAMRGIYSNGQEKILIMLNGHRLNSYCTNIASPDFSMSLEKIRQIEVLRGPASSLYGGVSLTAVVNIITKQGADIDGFKVRAGGGSYGTIRGDILFGKRYFDLDIFIWGSLYKADGQEFYVDNPKADLSALGNDIDRELAKRVLTEKKSGDITVGGVGNKPSYDMGINMKWKDLHFMYNTRFSQIVSPYTMSYLYAPYDRDKYMTYNGIKPSYATQTHHLEASYAHQLKNVWLRGRVTYDNSDLTHYEVISDTQVPYLGSLLQLPSALVSLIEDKEGLSRYINGQEQSMGGQVSGDYRYVNTPVHKGSLSFGAEINHFSLADCRYVIGYSYNDRVPESNVISEMGKASEDSYDAFAQLKHQWNSFILNAGLRYDYKKRYDEREINEFSPRLALIFVRPKWNVKLSYSKAFIDAPYLYRKTNDYLSTLTSQAKDVLIPETFHSYQITFAGNGWLKGFDFEVNGFYNRARDLIYMQLIDHSNTANTNTYGIEFTGKYTSPKFTGSMNLTYQKLGKSYAFNEEIDKAFNIPEIMANVVVGWKPFKRLKLHTHLTYYGSQKSYTLDLLNVYIQNVIKNAPEDMRQLLLKAVEGLLTKESGQTLEQHDVSSRLLVNLGARYTLTKNLEIGINVKNLFDKEYYQSGMGTGEIRQQGRWIIGDISFKF